MQMLRLERAARRRRQAPTAKRLLPAGHPPRHEPKAGPCTPRRLSRAKGPLGFDHSTCSRICRLIESSTRRWRCQNSWCAVLRQSFRFFSHRHEGTRCCQGDRASNQSCTELLWGTSLLYGDSTMRNNLLWPTQYLFADVQQCTGASLLNAPYKGSMFAVNNQSRDNSTASSTADGHHGSMPNPAQQSVRVPCGPRSLQGRLARRAGHLDGVPHHGGEPLLNHASVRACARLLIRAHALAVIRS
jgi:hypothetical protein